MSSKGYKRIVEPIERAPVPMAGPVYAASLAWPMTWRLLAAQQVCYGGWDVYLLEQGLMLPAGYVLLAVTASWWIRRPWPSWIGGLAFAWFAAKLVNNLDFRLHQAFWHEATVSSLPTLAFAAAWVSLLVVGLLAKLRRTSLFALGWPTIVGVPLILGSLMAYFNWPFRLELPLDLLGVFAGILPVLYVVRHEAGVRVAYADHERGRAANALLVGMLGGWLLKLTGQRLWPGLAPLPPGPVMARGVLDVPLEPTPSVARPREAVLQGRPLRRGLGWLAFPAVLAALATAAVQSHRVYLPWPDSRVEVVEAARGAIGNAQVLAVARDGTVLGSDGAKVFQVKADGQLETLTRPDQRHGLRMLTCLADAGGGAVYAGGDKLMLLTADGHWKPGPQLPNGRRAFDIVGLASAPDGSVWVRQREQLHRVPERWRRPGEGAIDQLCQIAPNGRVTTVVGGPDRWSVTSGLLVAPDGSCLLEDAKGAALIEVRPDGAQRTFALHPPPDQQPLNIAHLAFDPQGRLYASGDNTLYAIAPDGTATLLNPEAVDEGRDRREPEVRWGAGGLRGACFLAAGDLACDPQGHVLVGGYGLRRVVWRNGPPAPPFKPAWGAWQPMLPLVREPANPPPPELLLHASPLPPPPGKQPFPIFDEARFGEDVFVTAARWRTHLKVVKRDELDVPEVFEGTVLGRPHTRVTLLWGRRYTYTDTERVWPYDGATIELVAPNPRHVGTYWHQLYRQLKARYGKPSRFIFTHGKEFWYVDNDSADYAERVPKLDPYLGKDDRTVSIDWRFKDFSVSLVNRPGDQPGLTLNLQRYKHQ